MQKTELNLILQELYSWNPDLKKREIELINLINKMVEAKPDTKFDKSFAESLKNDLLTNSLFLNTGRGLKKKYLLFNIPAGGGINKIMNKRIYAIVGSSAIVFVVAVFMIMNNIPTKKINGLSLLNTYSSDQLVKSAPGAFGGLTSLNSASTSPVLAKGQVSVVDGAELIASAPNVGKAESALVTPNVATRSMLAGPARMIAPAYSYKFEYKGEPLDLKEGTGIVYRRIKGDGNLSSNIDSLIGSNTFGPINLTTFSNLKTSNISLSEDKKLGLNINIDFNEENIYISENWQKWQSARDNCGENQACYDSYRIKISDIPEDSNLIAMSDSFLSAHRINLDHYGKPVVDNNWRSGYEIAADKTNFYIPEYSNLVYPLIVDGQSVYDQSGNIDGLRVTVNLLQKAVSSVSNLMPYRYETSEYPLETSSDKILGLALKGGNNYYYNNGQPEVVIELGTPFKSLTRYYRSKNNVNEELLIPALIFPIKNAPADYYGSKFITIPLVKEMADEMISNGSTGGGIVPMMR